MNISYFANKIRELRKQFKKTQRDMAKDLSLGQGGWSKYEHRKHVPSLTIAIQIADYFNVSLDELVGRNFQNPQIKPDSKTTVDAFVEIMESLIIIMHHQKRPDIIEALRGLLKDIAERRGVKDVAEKMSRKKYKRTA